MAPEPLTEGSEIKLGSPVAGSQLGALCAVELQLDALRKAAKAANAAKDHRYFGLEPFGDTDAGKLGYIVGVGRLPEAPNHPIIVNPRDFTRGTTSFQIDYLQMYAACAGDPEVSRHLDQCLTLYADEAPVELEDAPDWSLLIALAFLKELHDLVQRQLRRGFVQREADLRARVRGQIDINRYITRSLTRGHAEIIPCRFQEFQTDTLENRILRAGLTAARRLLDGATGLGTAWQIWARQADQALAGASITRVTHRDLHQARRTGAYRHYARPLDLAKAVLTRAGFDPNTPLNTNKARIIPFRLLTYELLERYVEHQLRACAGWSVWAGYHDRNLGEKFKIRPDFIITNGDQKIIVDAKYKDMAAQSSGAPDSDTSFRSDVYQLMAYSRHQEVKKLAPENINPTMVLLVYPGSGTANCLNIILNPNNGPPALTCHKSFTIPLAQYAMHVPSQSI